MVKVGTVYKSNGNVDLTTLPLKVKLSIFINNMIDNSYILSGNRSKMLSLEEEARKKKIKDYTIALLYYLERSSYKHQQSILFTFPIEDLDLIKTSLGNPSFFPYQKDFIPLEPNLLELKAYRSGVVIIRRLNL